jgi:prevent-host-death family protein
MKATVLDLRYRTKDVLKAVERGETVTVLYRGKPQARLVPLEPAEKWKDREDMADVAAYIPNLRRGRFGVF